ncbi:PREDICTED: splicing factor 3B subunit 6, partial [Propithecus coquereli]|uniref:splicing factor 3B subunit 6 n=1 Tax=Propithecus coquereli TaxID=379532 RepID=UPI00063F6857
MLYLRATPGSEVRGTVTASGSFCTGCVFERGCYVSASRRETVIFRRCCNSFRRSLDVDVPLTLCCPRSRASSGGVQRISNICRGNLNSLPRWRCKRPRGRTGNTPETRGTAYVVYEDIFDAKNACDHLSGFNVCNRYLVVLYYNANRAFQKMDTKKKEEQLKLLKEKY